MRIDSQCCISNSECCTAIALSWGIVLLKTDSRMVVRVSSTIAMRAFAVVNLVASMIPASTAAVDSQITP